MTTPTADAAKLLPCPFCGGEVQWVDTDWSHHVDCFSCRLIYGPMGQTKEQIIAAWNTRPQPAPPEGELDWQSMVNELDQMFRQHHTDADVTAILKKRLGLAARTKVEDEEVAVAIKWLSRNSAWPEDRAAADLLERLAGDLAGYCNDWRALYEAIGLSKDEGDAKKIADRVRELVTTEAKLAEREAELAKAYEAFMISEMTGTLLDDKSAELINEVRHAARQQQEASAEKDKT